MAQGYLYTEVKLKKCPFDGGEARPLHVGGPLPYVVECLFCKARTGRFRLIDLAIKAWDRRVP